MGRESNHFSTMFELTKFLSPKPPPPSPRLRQQRRMYVMFYSSEKRRNPFFLLVVQHLVVCLMCSPTGSSRVRWNQKSFTLTLMRSVSEAENIITLAVAKIQWWSCCSVGSDSRHFHCHAVLPSLSPLHVIKSMIFCFSSRPNVVRTHATTIDTTMILFWNKSTE